MVETELFIARGRPAQVELGREPPVQDVDALLRVYWASIATETSVTPCRLVHASLEGPAPTQNALRHGPEVARPVDIPLGRAGRRGLEAVVADVRVLGMLVGAALYGVRMAVLLAAAAADQLFDVVGDLFDAVRDLPEDVMQLGHCELVISLGLTLVLRVSRQGGLSRLLRGSPAQCKFAKCGVKALETNTDVETASEGWHREVRKYGLSLELYRIPLLVSSD